MSEELGPNYALGLTPQPGEEAPDGDSAWRFAMRRIITDGQEVWPRSIATRELLHEQLITVDMARAVVTSPARKLSYQFMAAEALWICDGKSDLASLTRFAPSMANYSDNGVTLFGAYGPRIADQFMYVVATLRKDRDTRQAVLTIWDRNPPMSKDIPCTVAMAFSIRKDRLHQHVFMRSSDVWLGVPYDMFSFAAVGLKVACMYNLGLVQPVLPGHLTISMTSSHLYSRNFEQANAVLSAPSEVEAVKPVPDAIIRNGDWDTLHRRLEQVRDGVGRFTWEERPHET